MSDTNSKSVAFREERLNSTEEDEDEEKVEEDGDENESESQNQNGDFTDDDYDERDNYRGETESGQSRHYSAASEKSYCPTEKIAKIIAKKALMRSNRPEDPTNPLRLKEYLKHRHRVNTAKSIVDSSSPFAPKMQYTSKSYNRRLLNFARIERENTIMLQHLANIIHGKGSVDNKWQRTTVSTNNRGQTRQMRLLRITFDNLTLLKRIQSQKPFYSRQEQLAEYGRNEEVMTQLSYYPLFWQIKDSCKWGSLEGRARANAQNRPRARCFLDVGNQFENFGRVIIDLYASVCPMTAENFRALCTGEYGMTYKCSTIHRVIPDLLWQGGDITGQGGTGNKSIYGESFPDENFKLKHDKAGTVSMANCGQNSNGSQFIIAAKPLAVLDGSNVVFGRVVGGMNVLKSLYKNVAASGRPKKKLWIIECGELDPDSDISEHQEDEDEEEEDEQDEYENGEEENTISEPTTYATEEEADYSESGVDSPGADNTNDTGGDDTSGAPETAEDNGAENKENEKNK